MSIIIYGIPNCSSVKKARTFLEEKGLNYEFHDYKKSGANEEKLYQWCEEFGWEIVLNKKGAVGGFGLRKIPAYLNITVPNARVRSISICLRCW